MTTRGFRKTAFSLLELLVAMAVIVLLTALAIPAFNSINAGRSLEGSAQRFADQIALARQTAMSKNRTVEVRLMKYLQEAGNEPAFAGIQLVEVNDNGTDAPLGRVEKMPASLVISESVDWSSVLGPSGMTSLPLDQIPTIAGIGKPLEVRYFRFRPNGRTDFSDLSAKYFFTVQSRIDLGRTPANFATIQIDPVNGRVRVLRP